jgi:hypothetical protein
MIPARELHLGGLPSDTMGGANVVRYESSGPYGGDGPKSRPGKLDVDINGVNSLFPLFAVDTRITVETTDSSVTVTRAGDQYPDMEVVQYRSNQCPRMIATSGMANENGLHSVPLAPNMNTTWRVGA